MTSYRLTFVTPLFSKGSYDDRPEVRPASIRGQLHWWFRALGGKPADENAIFGSVHSKPVLASKIVVRVSNVQGSKGEVNTLPHKNGGQASPKWAFTPGACFDLHLLERLGGLSETHRAAFVRTMETWLLLGTLGLRATRAGGSFSWQPLSAGGAPMPVTLDAWQSRCVDLLKGAPLKFHLTRESFNADEARRIVSDTIGGRDDSENENSLARINHPLGRVFGGPRKTSPLRFRIIPIADRFHIAAVWDDRAAVTGNHPGDLGSAISLLNGKEKRIGALLRGFE